MANSFVNSRIVKISRPAAPASKLAAKSGMAGLGLRGDRRAELSSGFTGLLACAPRTGGLPTHRGHIHDVYVNVKASSKIFSALWAAATTGVLTWVKAPRLRPCATFRAVPAPTGGTAHGRAFSRLAHREHAAALVSELERGSRRHLPASMRRCRRGGKYRPRPGTVELRPARARAPSRRTRAVGPAHGGLASRTGRIRPIGTGDAARPAAGLRPVQCPRPLRGRPRGAR